MLLQILVSSLARTNYPINLKGKYKARICGIDYRDSSGTGQHFVLRCRSSNFQAIAGTYGTNAFIFSNQPAHGRTYDAPEIGIDAQGSIDLEFDQVAGTGSIGTLDFIILTFEIQMLEDE